MSSRMKKYQVPRTAITERGLKRLIKDAAKEYTSIAEWAVQNEVTPQSVSSFFRKVQGPGLKIPEILGYRPQIVYLPLDEPLIQEPTAPRRPAKRPTNKVDHSKPPIEGKGKNEKRVNKSTIIEKLRRRREREAAEEED